VEAQKASILPAVSLQISGPVDSKCASRFAVLSNWLAQMASGQLLRQAAGDLLILVRVAVGHRGHLAQFRAQGLDDLILLGGLVVGHHDDAR
jgi:hypothetical protein